MPSATLDLPQCEAAAPEAPPAVGALNGALDQLVLAAQNGDESATEALLEQFRPLLRSRMHIVWSAVRESFSSLEWDDVEAQLTLLFLSRLHAFRPEVGVYFPHYIERMLDLDCRSWLRQQRRGGAVPFSQLGGIEASEEFGDVSEWLMRGSEHHSNPDFDRALSLRDAVNALATGQRDVVWKCCVLGRTESAVACELGLSRSAVRNRLEAAIVKMREFFGETHELASEVGGTTRTGRAATKKQAVSPQAKFWEFFHDMAKDEKRPDLVGVGAGRPVLLQGTYEFPATGLHTPELLSKKLTYTVPPGHVLGVRYLRVGSVSEGMIVVSSVVNGLPHRLVPCPANSAQHVSFAIVDPLPAGSQIEIHVASQQKGTVIIDCGCLLMPA